MSRPPLQSPVPRRSELRSSSPSLSLADTEAREQVPVELLAKTELHGIADLLQVLELSNWTKKFQDEDIDLVTLFYLTDQHLVELGLSLSERIKLLRCVQLFKDTPPPSNRPPGAPPPRRCRLLPSPTRSHFFVRHRAAECGQDALQLGAAPAARGPGVAAAGRGAAGGWVSG